MACNVLRCPEEVDTVFATGEGALRREYAVCWRHAAELTAGAEWRVDEGPRSHVILMGADLATDVLDYAKVSISWGRPDGSDTGTQHALTLTGKRRYPSRSEPDEQEFSVEMTLEQMRQVADHLLQFVNMAAPKDGS